MPEPASKPMAADEFLDWDDGTDTRHELVDGVALAMTPTTDAHGTIAGNAGGEANHRLERRSPCRTVAEASVYLDNGDHYKADVAATCAEPRGKRPLCGGDRLRPGRMPALGAELTWPVGCRALYF